MSFGIVKTWKDQFPGYPYEDACWGLLPTHMRQPVYDYVMLGQRTGGFLASLISDASIREVWEKADQMNRDCMDGWMQFLYNYFPGSARGSRAAVEAWIVAGGIRGNQD